MNTPSQSRNENWRPLALMLVGVAAILVLVIRLIPYEYRLPNFAPAGAMFLFVGARFRPGLTYLIPFGLLAGIDLYFLQMKGWGPSPFVYLSYAIYVFLGWRWLRNSESPLQVGALALAGSLQFFLITNFGVWLNHVLKPDQYVGSWFQFPPTLAGLMECYEVALPFYRGTLLSDVIFAGALLGAHAWLARTYFPAERVQTATTSEINS